jgi:hypothetical protein
MRAVIAIRAVLCLSACDASEGPLLVRSDPAAAHDAGRHLRATVTQDMRLQYQITGELDTQVTVDLFVSDLFDTSADQVRALHQKGRVVVAYTSVGSLEHWRDDADRFPRAAVGDALADYPNESWLDLRSAEVRALMRARFDLALQKGFDGVFASTLGSYRATTGFPLTRADELDYTLSLADAAHARSLSFGLSGDFELGADLYHSCDWALAIGCLAASTCSALAPLAAAGLPVFDVEVAGDRTSDCANAAAANLSVTFKHSAYDAYRFTCA